MSNNYSRRRFVAQLSASVLAAGGVSAFISCGLSEQEKSRKMNEQKAKGKYGIALVGLGKYSEGQLAPALLETQQCYLAGVVTGTPSKADTWKNKYRIPEKNIYNYSNFDKIRDNPDIDIVYVVLPNSMHADYVIRAAKAGKHVICEKPMALNVDDCDRMIEACKKADRLLSIGYRLHFEPHNMEMMRIGKDKDFGEIKTIQADNGMADVSGWRLNKELAGGGPLMDVGIYCVQGCRYTTGLEPIAVSAQETPKTDPEKFATIEEGLTWQFEFPGGITATCSTSYSKDMNVLRINAANGWAELAPAYEYEGIKGKTSKGDMKLPQVNQQARQMDDFAIAIRQSRPTPVPGEMGRQDVKILQAIYEAMETGERVEIG